MSCLHYATSPHMTGMRALALCMVCTLVVYAWAQAAPATAPSTSQTAPAPAPGGSQVETIPLDPFTRVALCVPFTVLVQPSSTYQLTVDAEDAVRSAITTLVDGSTLLLESTNFTTNLPIKVTVGLPATQLSAVTARSTFPGVVAPGFTTSKLSLNAQGTSELSVLGVSTAALDVSLSGTGRTVVTGDITNASIRSSGTGNLYLSGVNSSVAVMSSGTGDVSITSANDSLSIMGASTGLGKVFYDNGQCQITSNAPDWVFGPKCQQSRVQLPDTSASWTCGIQVTGRYACTGGSASISTVVNCQASPVAVPNASGAVSSYSLVDSKAGAILGLDTNTTPQPSGEAAANTPLAVNGLANGVNNTPGPSGGEAASTNGQGNGVGSVGAGNGNNNGNNNAGGLNGNNNGVGNVGNGNGSGNGNGNTNSG